MLRDVYAGMPFRYSVTRRSKNFVSDDTMCFQFDNTADDLVPNRINVVVSCQHYKIMLLFINTCDMRLLRIPIQNQDNINNRASHVVI